MRFTGSTIVCLSFTLIATVFVIHVIVFTPISISLESHFHQTKCWIELHSILSGWHHQVHRLCLCTRIHKRTIVLSCISNAIHFFKQNRLFFLDKKTTLKDQKKRTQQSLSVCEQDKNREQYNNKVTVLFFSFVVTRFEQQQQNTRFVRLQRDAILDWIDCSVGNTVRANTQRACTQSQSSASAHTVQP